MGITDFVSLCDSRRYLPPDNNSPRETAIPKNVVICGPTVSALDMGDGGFRSLVKWLESLQEARRIWPFDPLEDKNPMKKIVIRFVNCGRSSRIFYLLTL